MPDNNTIESLRVNYRGADIVVELLEPPGARLRVNGISRRTETAEPPCSLQLSTSVQTDYEWHEFIDVRVDCGADQTSVSVDANNTRIAEASFPAFSST